jgi:hypothetical protein
MTRRSLLILADLSLVVRAALWPMLPAPRAEFLRLVRPAKTGLAPQAHALKTLTSSSVRA